MRKPIIELRLYTLPNGRVPFSEWLESLRDRDGRAKIRVRLDRIRLGNLGDCKSVGAGVLEVRVQHGPGYRVYLGREGNQLVILLSGGDKSTQDRDIVRAKAYWAEYKDRCHETD